jgi:hypothetical protein
MAMSLAPWMTAEYAANSEIKTFNNAVFLKSLYGVGTACRCVPACGR